MKQRFLVLCLGIGLTGPALAAGNPVEGLSRKLATIERFRGTVRMEAIKGKESRQSRGELFAASNRLHLHLIEPDEYEVYQDAEYLRIYRPANRVVEVYRGNHLSPEVTLLLGRIQKLPWDSLRMLGTYSFEEKGINKEGRKVFLGTPPAKGQPKCLLWLFEGKPEKLDFYDPNTERRLNRTLFSEYQSFHGIPLPLKVEIRDRAFTFRMHFEKVVLNPVLSEKNLVFKALPGMLIEKKD